MTATTSSRRATKAEGDALDVALALYDAKPDMPIVRQIRQKPAGKSRMQEAIEAARAKAAAEEAQRFEAYPCCGGVGYVRAALSMEEAASLNQKTLLPPVGHRLFGKMAPCQGGKCKAYQAIMVTRLEKLSIVPRDLLAINATWATFPTGVDRKALTNVRNYATAIIKGKQDRRGLVMRGMNQIGKTGMAFCVHRDLRAATMPSVFIRTIDFLDRMQAALMNDEDRMRHLTLMSNFASVTHLVLDDLGAEKPTEKREEWLYNLLDQRMKDPDCFTTITTNLEGDALREKLGDRIYSRITGSRSHVFQIKVAGEMNVLKGGA